jgi:hypothetical protein
MFLDLPACLPAVGTVCLRKETIISMQTDSVIVAYKKSQRCRGYGVHPLRAKATMASRPVEVEEAVSRMMDLCGLRLCR